MNHTASELRKAADAAESIESMGIAVLGCHTFKNHPGDRPVVFVSSLPQGATPISSKSMPMPGLNTRRRVVRASYRGVILECVYYEHRDRQESASVH